jgi:hypothetical protein
VKVNAIKENSGLSSGNLDVAAKVVNSTASVALDERSEIRGLRLA